MAWKGIIEQYREFLPVTDKTPVVSLQEGGTPLVRTKNLKEAINPKLDIYLKFDGANPTGSFKDRGMVMAISKAVEEGDKAIICASTGNTSASAAAYGAVAGLETIIVLPKGKIALGKMIQGIAAGAKVLAVTNGFGSGPADLSSLILFDSSDPIITKIGGIAAGMSGSPVYIDGKLLGAVAVSFAFAKEPVAGITPIEEMLEVITGTP